MKKLRVGVVGLRRGRQFVGIFSQLPGCEVVAVCDTSESVLRSCPGPSAHTDYAQFLSEGLDIVAVVTPGPLHAEQSVAAMRAGADVLCETPCVYSSREAESIVDCVRTTGKRFMLAEDCIWMGWVSHLKREIEERNVLGDIVYAEGDYTHDCRDLMLATENGNIRYAERDQHPGARKTWRATDLPPLFYTSHTLGPLLHLMDDRAVSAIALGTGCRTAPDLGATDLETGLLETGKGSIIRLTNGFSLAHPGATHYTLCGTKGSVRMRRLDGFSLVWYSECTQPAMSGWSSAPEEWQTRSDGENQVSAMIRDFVESIRADEDTPLSVHRSLDFVLPGITAHESACRGGAKIPVPDLRA